MSGAKTQPKCPICKEPLDDWAKFIYREEKGERWFCDNCEKIVITKKPKIRKRGYRRIELG